MSDVDTSDADRRRNKRWPEALKREIVAATCGSGASVSVEARQYDVNANQVFAWRRRLRAATEVAKPALVPVAITPEPEEKPAPAVCDTNERRSPKQISLFKRNIADEASRGFSLFLALGGKSFNVRSRTYGVGVRTSRLRPVGSGSSSGEHRLVAGRPLIESSALVMG